MRCKPSLCKNIYDNSTLNPKANKKNPSFLNSSALSPTFSYFPHPSPDRHSISHSRCPYPSPSLSPSCPDAGSDCVQAAAETRQHLFLHHCQANVRACAKWYNMQILLYCVWSHWRLIDCDSVRASQVLACAFACVRVESSPCWWLCSVARTSKASRMRFGCVDERGACSWYSCRRWRWLS